MNLLDNYLRPPEACAQWCRSQPYEIQVLDDAAEVDLDWWNLRLRLHHLDIRLRGRDADGRIVDTGQAVALRGDLRVGSELLDGGDQTLGLMYLCAAWQGGHKRRKPPRRFPRMDSYDLRRDEYPLDKIRRVLDGCVTDRTLPHDLTNGWSGFPETPDVGPGLLATFMWAAGVKLDGGRAQFIDQHGLSSLVHCGWMGLEVLSGCTRRRYNGYVELLESWSQIIQRPPELIECWLVSRWHARKMEIRTGQRFQPSLF